MPWPSDLLGCQRRFRQRCFGPAGAATRIAAPCVGAFDRLVPQRCQCCKRRRRKEKGAEDEEDDLTTAELEMGQLGAHPRSLSHGHGFGNGQDADDQVPLVAAVSSADVPSWQMPKLVVECSRRHGARVHKGNSLILPEAGGDLIGGIVSNLPVLLQIRPCWHLGYSMAVDGVSLRTMYRQVSEVGPCVLIVEDSNYCIFGAFLSEGLKPASQCYGTHECFVFRYPRHDGGWHTEVFAQAPPRPETTIAAMDACASESSGTVMEGAATEQFEALKRCQAWVVAASPSGAVFCDHTGIVVGIDGPGLFIDQDLLRGVSWPSKAFGSPTLAGAGPDFVVRNLEVWHWAPA